MLSIEIRSLTTVEASPSVHAPAEETALLIGTGVVIHPGIATVIPLETYLFPLTSVQDRDGDKHLYRVTVRGYTVQEFVDIAYAYADEDFQVAESKIKKLRTGER